MEEEDIMEIQIIRESRPRREFREPGYPTRDESLDLRYAVRTKVVEEIGPCPANLKDRDLECKLDELGNNRTVNKLRNIALKLNEKRPLSDIEKGYWDTNKGFLRAESMEWARQLLQRERFTIEQEPEEVCRNPRVFPEFPPLTAHEGPKLMEDLRRAGNWMAGIQLVLIGTSILTHYPILENSTKS